MIRLSDVSIGGTVWVGNKAQNRLNHLAALHVKRRVTIGTWQRVGLACPLADFYAQEEPDAPMMAFRVIGEERRI